MPAWLHKVSTPFSICLLAAATTAPHAKADIVLGKITNIPVSATPTAITLADVDLNGHLDIVTASSNGKVVQVLLNQGAGTFATAATYPVGSIPTGVAVGDVTGDHVKDIVVSNAGNSTVSVLKGIGKGSFSLVASPSTKASPNAVIVGDINHDGIDDIVTANAGTTGSVTVLLSLKDGAFQDPAVYPAGNGSVSVILEDVNGDSHLDVVTANKTNSSVSVLRGDGKGTLSTNTNFKAGTVPYDIVSGDFNGDKRMDLAVADNRANGTQVLINAGESFQAPVLNTAGSYAAGVGTGDLNADGFLDIVMINQASQDVVVFTGRGDGSFDAPVISATGVNHSSVAVGDVNGDGLADVVTTNVDNTISLILNDTSAPTSLTYQPATTSVGSFTVATVGISRNAPADGAVLNLSASANGLVLIPPTVTVPAGARSVQFVVAAVASGTVAITANCNGVGITKSLIVTPSVTSGGVPGDLNCDGRIDSADAAILARKIVGKIDYIAPCN